MLMLLFFQWHNWIVSQVSRSLYFVFGSSGHNLYIIQSYTPRTQRVFWQSEGGKMLRMIITLGRNCSYSLPESINCYLLCCAKIYCIFILAVFFLTGVFVSFLSILKFLGFGILGILYSYLSSPNDPLVRLVLLGLLKMWVESSEQQYSRAFQVRRGASS